MSATRIYRIDQEELRRQIVNYGGQKVVAKASGISLRSISCALNTDPFVQRSTLFALANVFQIAPWVLCDKVVIGWYYNGNPRLADYSEAMFRSELIPGFGKAGNLMEVFRKIYQSLVKSAPDINELGLNNGTVRPFDHVEEYWGAKLQDGDLVSICGALSPLSPLLIGNPQGLLTLHNKFRDLAEDGEIKTPLSSANMSLSAGQVVWDVGQIGNWQVLGLYHSIARNGFLVFMDHQEFKEGLRLEFKEWCRDAAEVRLTGRVVSVNGFGNMIDGPLAECNNELKGTSWGLVVSRRIPGTSISVQSTARYLDGDLFAIVEVNDDYVLRTQPTNLSNPNIVDGSRQTLQAGIDRAFPKARKVIDCYDIEELKK